MKVCSKCKVTKPLSEFTSRKGVRDGKRSDCKACVKVWRRRNYLANQDERKASAKRYAKDHPEWRKEHNARYRKENPEKIKFLCARWVQENKDHIAAYNAARGPTWWAEYYKTHKSAMRANVKAYNNRHPEREVARHALYYKNNKSKFAAQVRKRQADKIKATPAWANLKEIEKFYELRIKLTAETGVKHHVDHIIPLRGKYVCGLHVHTNLQVIPAEVNLSKSNHMLEDV